MPSYRPLITVGNVLSYRNGLTIPAPVPYSSENANISTALPSELRINIAYNKYQSSNVRSVQLMRKEKWVWLSGGRDAPRSQYIDPYQYMSLTM